MTNDHRKRQRADKSCNKHRLSKSTFYDNFKYHTQPHLQFRLIQLQPKRMGRVAGGQRFVRSPAGVLKPQPLAGICFKVLRLLTHSPLPFPSTQRDCLHSQTVSGVRTSRERSPACERRGCDGRGGPLKRQHHKPLWKPPFHPP